MNTRRWLTTTVLAALGSLAAAAQPRPLPAASARLPGQHAGFCTYPLGRPQAPQLRGAVIVNESENNDTPVTADVIPLGRDGALNMDVDVSAALGTAADQDFFAFTAKRGDVLGVAALTGSAADPRVAVTDASGVQIILNDDHLQLGDLYPASSPMPRGVSPIDAALSWIVPTDGTYLLRVDSGDGLGAGAYTLQARIRRPLEDMLTDGKQIIFVDFDGATIDAFQTFGIGEHNAVLSPMSDFLGDWGLQTSSQSAVINAILGVMRENLDELAAQTPRFQYELRNSRDDSDPWGQPNVSRVIIGGTIDESGIQALGIAESIDPGNFAMTETALVLLDRLSGDPANGDSINGLALAPGVSKITAIGRVVGNIASHEVGHYLGNWHTENGNAIDCIMDRGGNGVGDEGGVGPDGLLGNGDDTDPDFIPDAYSFTEGLAAGNIRTELRSAFSLVHVPRVFVDAANSGFENGSASNPFNTVPEGVNAAHPAEETWLMIAGGSYPQSVIVSQPMLMRRNGGAGSVIVGQ